MSPRISLFSVLSNLAALASGYGPMYGVVNNCPDPINLYTSLGGQPTTLPPMGGQGSYLGVGNDLFYTDSYGGTASGEAMRAGFHATGDGDGIVDNYYYYMVMDVTHFNTGMSITTNNASDNEFCNVARCDDVTCTSAFLQPPTSFPPPGGMAPTLPLHSCPGTLRYDITFCPSGSPPSRSPFNIHPNSDTTSCLDVQDGNYANGTPVRILDCDGTTSQQWIINRGTTQVRTVGGNGAFCLDAGLPPVRSGTPMKIWQCYDNLPAQEWTYTSIDRIALMNTDQCLDVPNGFHTSGKRIQTWQCQPHNFNQIWTVTSVY